jgi:hypothetical protein
MLRINAIVALAVTTPACKYGYDGKSAMSIKIIFNI